MYEVIKRAPEYGLNKVYSNSQEFIEVIDTLGKEKENMTMVLILRWAMVMILYF